MDCYDGTWFESLAQSIHEPVWPSVEMFSDIVGVGDWVPAEFLKVQHMAGYFVTGDLWVWVLG
jgi:hypothetical protein